MVFDYKRDAYIDSTLLKSKYTAYIEIYRRNFRFDKKRKTPHHYWGVAFVVAKKRKDAKAWLDGKSAKVQDSITGDGSIESLIWAKNKLKFFEDAIRERGVHHIIVQWDDNRRRDVYIKYLTKKLGYKESIYNNKKCLSKTIIKEEYNYDAVKAVM